MNDIKQQTRNYKNRQEEYIRTTDVPHRTFTHTEIICC